MTSILVGIFTNIFLCSVVTPHTLQETDETQYQAEAFTFQRLDDLQAVGQVGPGSS